MTALIFQAVPYVEAIAPAFHVLGGRLLAALNGLAKAKMNNIVSAQKLRKAQRDVMRCGRLLNAGRKSRHAEARTAH